MAKVDTWMPIYWGDYAKDTGHLGAAHHGAYLMLIKHYWTHGGALPADDAQLWRIACADSPAHWRKIKGVVLAFFEERDGFLHHGRIDKEMANAEGNADRRAEMARRAAEARWNKPQSDAPGNAQGNAPRMRRAMRGECPPPSPSPSDNPHGETIVDAASASASPDGPPRPRLPDSAKWAKRLESYNPWLPMDDPARGKWQPSWGLNPDSAGRNPHIPPDLLAAWRAKLATASNTMGNA
tara:strand:+ start:22 stop:738 length:717 start_codon:yes stop_codon:yes gene_type:complete